MQDGDFEPPSGRLKILIWVIITAFAVMFLMNVFFVGPLTRQVEEWKAMVLENTIVLTIDNTPVVDTPDIEGQEYIEHEDGTITIILK